MTINANAVFWAVFIAGIFLACNALPTPKWMWQWRIKQEGDRFYVQARGFFKPWWHKVPGTANRKPIAFKTAAVAECWLNSLR